MKIKPLILIPLFSFAPFCGEAQIVSTVKGTLKLKGVAQQETIVAESNTLEGKFDIATRKFNFRQSLNQFSFSQGELQKRDAQEKYWETSKFPYATFKGSIVNDIDFTKNGEHSVTARGILSMHGIDKEVKLPATINVKDGTITVQTNFNIFLSDYNIKIPRLVVLKVSEVFEATSVLTLKKI
jgi:polyisoprenoid-binding protein YceI